VSVAYEAWFGPSPKSLEEILAALDQVLLELGIAFSGSVTRLHNQGGYPGVLSLDTEHCETMADVAKRAQRWFGVSLHCVSGPLMEQFGKSNSAEVFFAIFRGPDRRYLVSYSETRTVLVGRLESPTLAKGLYGLMLRIASLCDMDAALYTEERDELIVVDQATVIATLQNLGMAADVGAQAMVFRPSLVSLNEARLMVGRWAPRLKLSTAGYVLLELVGRL
jgi:hypothetical protein